MSCLKESEVFNHFTREQWKEVERLLRLLILATDVTQQNEYLCRFRVYLANPGTLTMTNPDHRLFILQIALKCADLGNPCRPWLVSKKWSEQICAEFYRQGDYERQLAIPITPVFNRYKATMAKIQTGYYLLKKFTICNIYIFLVDFFRNIVTPLFILWDQFLASSLSRQLIANLNFNNGQWSSYLDKPNIKRRHSILRLYNEPDIEDKKRSKSSKSLNDLDSIDKELSLADWKLRWAINQPKKCSGPHGCGTPPAESPINSISNKEIKEQFYLDNKVAKPLFHLKGSFGAISSISSHPLTPLTAQASLQVSCH